MADNIPDISTKYSQFPSDYINDVNGWGVSEALIKEKTGTLLTLDMDFGNRCSLNCPFCFRRNNIVDKIKHELCLEKQISIIKEAKTLGVRSVKLLGAGEPLENKNIIEFLEELANLELIPIVFTKTGIIGDDAAVKNHFGYLGITTGVQLAQKLFNCNASVVVGFNSFDKMIQEKMVGNNHDFVKNRNRTLEILSSVGFNNCNPTRLAVGINPITHLNLGEAFSVYKWARMRNIYPIVTPTMISGLAKESLWKDITPSSDDLIKLYVDIYKFNLAVNLTNPEKLCHEDVSAYAGGHPCNQVACGLYITLNGVVLSCPGSENNVEGNIWETSLIDLWQKSNNYKRRGTFNCRCITKDGLSIPTDLYGETLKRVLEKVVA